MRSKVVFAVLFAMLVVGAVFISCAPQTEKVEPPTSQPAVDSTALKQQINMYLSLGWENYKNKQYDRAIEHFKKVLELDPKNEKAYKFLTDAYLRHPDSTYIDTALNLFEQAIKKFPNNSYFYSGRGYIYQKLGDRFDKMSETTEDSAKIGVYEGKADSLEELARKDFVKAYSLDDKDAASSGALGTIWLRRGKLDSAMVWFEKSVAADSNRVQIWKILAKLYVARSNYDKAATAYSHLTRLVPDEPEYQLKLGQYLAKSGKFDEAAKMLQKYIDANPDDYRGYQYMGLALAADGKFNDALPQLKKAEKLNPKSVKLMCDIASTYNDMKRYNSAKTYIAKAKALDRSFGYIYIVEGDTYEKQAMDKVPKSGEINMEIKCQFLAATKIYRKALRDPDWSGFARSKIEYLKPYIPTKEEIAAYKFIEHKKCGEIE